MATSFLNYERMNFNQIIEKKLIPFFDKYNINIVENRNNYLKFQSIDVVIILTYNQLEYRSTLWLGKSNNEADKIEIDDFIITLFFKSDLKLNFASIENFTNNLILFFTKDAEKILIGETKILEDLIEFASARSKRYTEDLLKHQNLIELDKDWEIKNYKAFIKTIDKLNLNELPKSYMLKYKIALHNSDK